MSREIEVLPPSTQVHDLRHELTINKQDIERVKNHLDTIKEFVSSQLVEGIDRDYAIIPGTGKKKSLLKPGAEKLMRLFGLGVRFEQTIDNFDKEENFAMFAYKCEAYHLKTGTVIASCEGTTSSWEKKYKTKKVYNDDGQVVGEESVLVSDIINTLKKMAQKRAMVGAIIIATGASDYFTQDEDEIENQRPKKKPRETVDSSRFDRKKDEPTYIVPVGKYKNKRLDEIAVRELSSYVSHITENNPSIDGKLKEFVDKAREYLRDKKL